MARYRVAIKGSVYERDAIDAEEAARETVEMLWQDNPPGQDDAVTAHVIPVNDFGCAMGPIESWTVMARYSLNGHTIEADDEPTNADLTLLGGDRE